MEPKRLFAGTMWILAAACLMQAVVHASVAGKKKDEITQTLALPKDPPPVAVGETRRLLFHVTPLSEKGPLAQQTRDALHALIKLNGGLPVIHLRAFVAGSGDVRRIPQIVSEVFGEKKMLLPSVSVVRAGGLAMENAQVVFEAVSVGKRDVNAGLDFVVGEAATAPDPVSAPLPLLQRALDGLSAKLNGETALSVSCFVNTMNGAAGLSAAVANRFPSAATNVLQPQRGAWKALAICEGIARGSHTTADRLAFTGTRVAFGAAEKDAVLAFQRLDRDLAEAGALPVDIVFTNLYPLSPSVAEMSHRLRPSAAPVATIPFEGLASIDAGFAADAVATVSK